MERTCRVCGRAYRGLVCQACHPRTTRKRDAGRGGAGVFAGDMALVTEADTPLNANGEPVGAITREGWEPAARGGGWGEGDGDATGTI